MTYAHVTFSAEGTSLVVAHLPGPNAGTLVGLAGYGEHQGIVLSRSEVDEFRTAIEERIAARIQQPFRPILRMVMTNRGDPYREGIEISLGDTSIFLEKGYEVERLITFFTTRP